MHPRLARWLVSLYPLHWRRRYGTEFTTFLEDQPQTPSNVLDVAIAGAAERLRTCGGFKMNWRQRTLVLMAFGYLAAIAAGVNFYWTVNDTPLATAMRNNVALGLAFRTVAIASLVALAAIAAVAVPTAWSIARDALKSRQWKTLGRIATPLGSALILVVWLAAGAAVTGRHWIATPWDVTGDWSPPAAWPPLSIRWTMSSVTFVLMVAGLLGSGTAASHVIRDSDFSAYQPSWFRTTSVVFAASVLAMVAGIGAWGWFAQRLASADFHARNGGLFDRTNIASWTASCIVFAIASFLAIGAASSSFRGVTRARD
jgi:hypothetical protein